MSFSGGARKGSIQFSNRRKSGDTQTLRTVGTILSTSYATDVVLAQPKGEQPAPVIVICLHCIAFWKTISSIVPSFFISVRTLSSAEMKAFETSAVHFSEYPT